MWVAFAQRSVLREINWEVTNQLSWKSMYGLPKKFPWTNEMYENSVMRPRHRQDSALLFGVVLAFDPVVSLDGLSERCEHVTH